ncbi:MAG: hypothetical protein GW893_03370 [Armatimonadetes bacterium]|nr:hypothetical protein [Armatimonadota bacterium]
MDRRFTNDRVIIPPGRYSCDELLRLIALANGLEVRHVGKVKFLSPSGQDNIDPEVAEHLEDSLEEKLKDLLAYETARLKDEAIPFDLVDFLNERTFSWPNLTPRQQQFVQRMADAKIAEKNQRRMHANQPAGAMPGAPTADSPGVSASPLPRSRDLGKIRNLRVCLEPAYEVAITRYLLRQSGDARPRVYSPYETVSLIVE